ncbi:mitogen-activated protein kinase-like protein [Trypanosoma grayi]|uniref:mitogen-activated protein kinase-like protein n=1 Tax=Trypanosoma grayi TaxID=71804 RepID=UPI0004F49017|nr:mitogen-activated protein kinase-like protein [Trypanosoma grayi]KEG08715.1 mitogen-activated protein kinase-like protein [Trypanosoma grayi]
MGDRKLEAQRNVSNAATKYPESSALERNNVKANPLFPQVPPSTSLKGNTSIAMPSGAQNLQECAFYDETVSVCGFSGECATQSLTNDEDRSDNRIPAIESRVTKAVEPPEYSKPPQKQGDSLKTLKRRNCAICVGVLVFSVLLGVVSGLVIGLVGYRYNMLNQRIALAAKNRMVLNSSVNILRDAHSMLAVDSLNLLHYVQAMGTNYTSAEEMRDAYNRSFFLFSALGMASSPEVDEFLIFVPFCDEVEMQENRCHDALFLAYTCEPLRNRSEKCFYSFNNDSGVDTFEVLKDGHGAPFGLKWLRTESLSNYMVNSSQTPPTNSSGRYIGFVTSDPANEVVNTGVAHRRQFKKDGRTVVCEASGYTINWFRAFDQTLQKANESYSLIFNASGSILAYSYMSQNQQGGVPCHGITLDEMRRAKNDNSAQNVECGTNGAGVLDSIVELLLDFFKNEKTEPDAPMIGRSEIVESNGLVTAVQEFFFVEADPQEHKQLYAAYATPMLTGLDRQSVLQVIICVVVVVVSICVLGGVSLFSINQLQRTVELVSVLAVHVATYDLEKMQMVLDRKHQGFSVPFGFLGIDMLSDEFNKILMNLKAYRPYLPQALLTNIACPEWGKGRISDNGSSPSNGDDKMEGAYPPAPDVQETCIVDGSDVNAVVLNASEEGWQAPKLKRVKGTVIVAQLQGCVLGEPDSLTVIDQFLAFVLKNVRASGGVADQIETDHVIVTFNFHLPVIRHQQKACHCAIAIQEDCRKADMKVAIAITSGVNYVGTVGTDEQKARVVAGDGVQLAKRLVTLHRYLGSTILVTQQVAHESNIAAVPVDNVEVYSPYYKVTLQYVILEVSGSAHGELSCEEAFSKQIFSLILRRQGREARASVNQLMRKFASIDEAPWYARRLYELCKHNQSLIESGYRRKELLWAPLEGEELLERHMTDEAARQTKGFHSFDTVFTEMRDGSGNVADSGCGCGSMGSQYTDDVKRAKVQIDAQSSSSRRAMLVKPDKQGEDALISLFVQDEETPFESENVLDQDEEILHNGFPNKGLPQVIEDINHQIFYRTDELLGRGQFGEVYLTISASGTFVATKVFPLEENGAALVQEVEALIQLRHDNIVAYDTCAIQDGYFFIFTEYMAAGNMRQLISRLGRIPEKTVRKYGRDILFGLKFLHTMKYVHCDLKPDNVLLSSEGTCKLGDFGTVHLARSVPDRGATLRGTPRYMAPEAVMGNSTDKSDIYGFGLTMAHMLLGFNPWQKYEESDEHFLLRLARDDEDMRPALPTDLEDKELERAVRSCCEHDPALRPTVDELLSMLS